MKALKLVIALMLVLTGCASNPEPKESTVTFQHDAAIVEVESGKLRGFIDNGIYTYRGIPYATAGRFEEPQKVAAWSGIRDAQVYGDIAPQTDMTAGAAEALNPHYFWPETTDETQIQKLNIWTKSIDNTAKKPVMVWIHGGGFSTGSSIEQISYDGRNLVERGDVVLVSINHRLNVLGYLDLSAYGDEYKNSGNLGQMDIVAALQWVQDNIEQFGGDPDNVTVFGQSGGARKILNLMGTPSAKGLFHKAICESGYRQSITTQQAQTVAKYTLQNLGLTEATVEQIKAVDYDTLLAAASNALTQAKAELGVSVSWSPVSGGEFMPTDIWKEGIGTASVDIPLMIGSNFAEMTTNAFSYAMGAPTNKAAMTEEEIDAALVAAYGDKKDAVVEAFKKAYPNKPIIDAAYIDVNSYRSGILADIQVKAAQEGTAPIYNYVFALEFPTMGGWLPWHCSEIPFVFHNVEKVALTFSTDQVVLDMQDMVCDAWVSFAKTGDPNHTGMIEWPAYTNEEGATMIFEAESYIGNHHDADLIKAIKGQ